MYFSCHDIHTSEESLDKKYVRFCDFLFWKQIFVTNEFFSLQKQYTGIVLNVPKIVSKPLNILNNCVESGLIVVIINKICVRKSFSSTNIIQLIQYWKFRIF